MGPDADGDDRSARLTAAAAAVGEDVTAALGLAVEVGAAIPAPGTGRTRERWRDLAALARGSVTVGRVAEAHTDALAILDEAATSGAPGPAPDPRPRERTWGVFAAEAPGSRLVARPDDPAADGTHRLAGIKPWCSLGGVLERALVTAHVDGGRRLFAVDLTDPTVHPDPPEGWVARGLRRVVSVPVRFDDTPARPVGGVDWYLTRPGFAWGGMGVAACWYGGARGLGDAVRAAAAGRDGDLAALQLGRVDALLHGAGATLALAADRVDAGAGAGPTGARLAARVRAVVADTVEQVLTAAGHALGPAPLSFDAALAARVADLTVYVRQHHAERDLAALGRAVLATPAGAGAGADDGMLA